MSGIKTKVLSVIGFAIVAASTDVAGQAENFRPGDTVETSDGRVCKVLTVTGRSAKVACGANRSDLRVYSFDSMTSEAKAAARRQEAEQRRIQSSSQIPRPKTPPGVGDTVKTPSGKTGKIESVTGGVAKISFGAETDYLVLEDLTKIETGPPQRVYRLGESVNTSDGPGVIEEFSPNGMGAKVRFSGSNGFKWVSFENMKSPEEFRREAEQEKMARVFRPQARPFIRSAELLAQFYIPTAMDMKGTGLDDAGRQKIAADLAELDRICLKYPNIQNEKPINPLAEVSFEVRYADQCAMARDRESLLKKGKARFLYFKVEQEMDRTMIDINRLGSVDGQEVGDDIQMVIYEPAAWEQKNMAHVRKEYSAAGETMPADAFAPLYKKAEELKAKIDADALQRSWTQPKFKDAGLEAAGRAELAGDFPGAKVLRSGMTYTTWVPRDDRTYVGSDSLFRYYRITPGAYRFKRGLLLVKMPNRPHCQIREFQATQYKAGGGYGAAKTSGSLAGTFVKCP